VKQRLRKLSPMVRSVDTRTVRLPPKQRDPVYNSPGFLAFRAMVLRRAGYRCEAIDQYGHRCNKGRPEYTVYADHITELSDHGSLTDPSNGQCLCASHHQVKTMAMRMRRHQLTWVIR
jgi:5-methylcytosine-specific restriction enzyme A